MKDTKKIYELSQKHILASFNIAKINFILCCLLSTTIKEMINPAKNDIPMNRDIVEYNYAY